VSPDTSIAARPRRWGVALPVAVVGVAILLPIAIVLGIGFLLGWTFQPIETESMAPRYPAGSLAVVQPIDPADVEPGMTIVFTDPLQPDRLVAHRVVRQLPGDALAWETKGDANAEADPLPVHATELRGRISWVIPGLGTVVTALRGPQGVLLLVGLPLIILVATEFSALRRSRRRSEAKAQ
jgi:signal peptidase